LRLEAVDLRFEEAFVFRGDALFDLLRDFVFDRAFVLEAAFVFVFDVVLAFVFDPDFVFDPEVVFDPDFVLAFDVALDFVADFALLFDCAFPFAFAFVFVFPLLFDDDFGRDLTLDVFLRAADFRAPVLLDERALRPLDDFDRAPLPPLSPSSPSSSELINFFATPTAAGIATPSAVPATTFCAVDSPSSSSFAMVHLPRACQAGDAPLFGVVERLDELRDDPLAQDLGPVRRDVLSRRLGRVVGDGKQNVSGGIPARGCRGRNQSRCAAFRLGRSVRAAIAVRAARVAVRDRLLHRVGSRSRGGCGCGRGQDLFAGRP